MGGWGSDMLPTPPNPLVASMQERPVNMHETDEEKSLGLPGIRTGYLQFPPGIELLQAVHGLLSVHAGGHGGAVRDPWVLESLSGRDAFGRVDGQHLIDQILGFWGDGVPFW